MGQLGGKPFEMLITWSKNGIMEDYSPMRHMTNIETVFTYEGTHEMHSLILGQSVTGIAAYDS